MESPTNDPIEEIRSKLSISLDQIRQVETYSAGLEAKLAGNGSSSAEGSEDTPAPDADTDVSLFDAMKNALAELADQLSQLFDAVSRAEESLSLVSRGGQSSAHRITSRESARDALDIVAHIALTAIVISAWLAIDFGVDFVAGSAEADGYSSLSVNLFRYVSSGATFVIAACWVLTEVIRSLRLLRKGGEK